MQAQLAGDERGGFGTLDLFLGGNSDDEIASFRAAGFGEFFYILRADQFFNRGRETFGCNFHKISATRFERLCFFSQFV